MAHSGHEKGEPSIFSFLYNTNFPGSHYDREYQQLVTSHHVRFLPMRCLLMQTPCALPRERVPDAGPFLALAPYAEYSTYLSYLESKLGSGGFGSVYLAKSILDKNYYAIKKIAVSAEKFLGPYGQENLRQLLAEVESLAQLDHHNIVRYYHAWLEERAHTKNTREDSDSDSDYLDVATEGVQSIQLGLEKSLFKDISRQRAKSMADEESRDHIVFETSNPAKATRSYKSAFRHAIVGVVRKSGTG